MPDIVTSKTFVDGEKGITAAKMNQIISGAVIQPAFYSAKPSSATLDPTDVLLELKGTGAYAQITGTQVASSVAGQLPVADATQNGMLRQVSGLTTDVVDGTNHCVPIASMPGITQMRLRSFNAIGNPTFEVDQRQVNASVSLAAGPSVTATFDRWSVNKLAATAVCTAQLVNNQKTLIPGTNFCISNGRLVVTVSTAQATLAGSEYIQIPQTLEGPRLRELISDVHSIQLLCYCSVALNFAISLRQGSAYSLVLPVSIPAATLTLVTLPNLPVWTSSATWNLLPGNVGYSLSICLGTGTAYQAPLTGSWVSGNFLGYAGQTNFMATAGAQFYAAFCQDEPGSSCTTPIDCPFTQNYDECLRYYAKSYDYAVKPGTASGSSQIFVPNMFVANWPSISGYFPFPKPMAKAATIIGYSPTSGAVNTIRDNTNGADRTVTSVLNAGEKAFGGFGISGQSSTGQPQYVFHYTADTGW
jgi:hypothetical protein